MLILVICPSPPVQPSPPDPSGQKASKLVELRNQIRKLQASLNAVQNRRGGLRQQLRSTEVTIGTLSRNLKDLKKQLRHQTRRLKDLQRTEMRRRKALGVQKRELGRQITTSYAVGHHGYLKILLNQQDPSVIGRLLTYYDYFNRARSSRIEAINNRLAELTRLEDAITRDKSRIEKLYSEQRNKKDALEKQRRIRKKVLEGLAKEITTKEQHLRQLVEDEKRLSRLVDKLRSAASGIPPDSVYARPFAGLKGRLPWPARGRIEKKFGILRKLGKLKWHGVLIAAREGQEVRAIYPGRVVFADWLRGFGMLLILDHGQGYMSLYGYNQSLYKNTGDWVEGGDLLATVGTSGGRSTPSLYFEIRHNGAPSNPVKWCRADKP